jgi:hypothetical protein
VIVFDAEGDLIGAGRGDMAGPASFRPPLRRQPIMRQFLWMLAVLVLSAALAGCGSDKERGQNRDKDKPQAAEPKGQ